MNQGLLYHSAVVRMLHWLNAVSVVVLTLTGFYIHWPLQFGIFSDMDTARKLHFIFMYIVSFSILWRVYYSWLSGDYKDIMFRAEDIRGFPALAKYYTFLSRKLPDFGKYNPGQKMTYTGWAFLMVFQAISGFILYWPTALGGTAALLGGLMVVRMVHYLVTWIFVATVGLHVYLSFLGGVTVLKSIFTGQIPAGVNMQPVSDEDNNNSEPVITEEVELNARDVADGRRL